MLIESNLTYSYCVEHQLQRLLLDISAHWDLHIYGGDTSYDLSHRPGPSIHNFVYIDDQFAD